MFSRWLCDGAWDCGRSRFRGPCCGGARAFHLEGLSLVLYSTRAGARSSLVAHLRRSFRRWESRSLLRDAALARRLSGGAGARASYSCSPLVGAALLPVMGRPCRSSRCVGSALAGARVFGGRRSCHGIARRRAGRLLGWCGGVACIRVCTFGRRLPSSVVDRRSSAWRYASSHVRAHARRSLALVSLVGVGLVVLRIAPPRLLRGGLQIHARRCVVPWWPLGHQGT